MKKERIFSSAPFFFGASKQNPTTERVVIQMKDDVDGVILKEAVCKMIKRYPYFAVKVVVEDDWYTLHENKDPIVVANTDRPIVLGGKASNYHLLAFSWYKERFVLDCFHGLADGKAILAMLKTLLYYYCSDRYNRTLDTKDIRLDEKNISLEEILDPYPENVDANIVPMGRYRNKGAVRLFSKEECQASKAMVSRIQFAEDAFIKYSKQQDGSPATMIALLMARAVKDVLGETEEPIVCGLAMDIRSILNKPLTHHSVVSQLFLEYNKSVQRLELANQATAFRGMVMLQGQYENVMTSVRNNMQFIKSLEKIPTLEERKLFMNNVLSKAMNNASYKVSYVGQAEFGDAMEYIENISTYVDIKDAGMMMEVNACNGMFDICFMQETEDDRFLKALLRQFEYAGIEVIATEFTPYKVSDIEFE